MVLDPFGRIASHVEATPKKKRIYKTLPTFVVIGTPFEKREDGTILIGDNEAVKTRDFVYFTRAEHKFQATKPDPCNPKKRIPRDAIFSFNANNLDNEKEPEKKTHIKYDENTSPYRGLQEPTLLTNEGKYKIMGESFIWKALGQRFELEKKS